MVNARADILEIGSAVMDENGTWNLTGWVVDGKGRAVIGTDFAKSEIGGWTAAELATIATQHACEYITPPVPGRD